jgi:hypothetical protein
MVVAKGQEPNETNLNPVTIHPSIHPSTMVVFWRLLVHGGRESLEVETLFVTDGMGL